MAVPSYIFLSPPKRGTYNLRPTYGVNPPLLATLQDIKRQGEVVHFDLETQGLCPLDGTLDIVSISLGTSRHLAVWDTRTWITAEWKAMFEALIELGGIAYNSAFDYKWLYHKALRLEMGDALARELLDSMKGCSLTLFRALANERYLGQGYSLADAQAFLGLETNNKVWLAEALKKHELSKSEMWKLMELEYDDFLKYNAEDSDVSWMLWGELTAQLAARDMEHVLRFHETEQLLQIREQIVQNHHGLPIDIEGMKAHADKLKQIKVRSEAEFKLHPNITPHLQELEAKALEKFYKLRVSVKKHWAKKSDKPMENMDDGGWVFDGTAKPIASWEKEIGGRFYRPETKFAITNQDKPFYGLNLHSSDQIREIFFGRIYNYEIFSDGRRRMARIHLPTEDGGTRAVELRLTKAAQKMNDVDWNKLTAFERTKFLPFDSSTYSIFGEPGKIYSRMAKASTELAYVEKAISRGERSGSIHLEFIPYGTMTGRVNGTGGFSFVQQPKSEGYMSCMKAPEGKMLYSLDIVSLEKVVQAEFSRDPNLMKLYGEGVPHDVYLFNAMSIHPNPNVRAAIKAMYRSDKKVLAEMKVKFKKERTFIKPAVLGLDYGLYPYSMYIDWQSQGYDVTYEDCLTVFNNYWETYKGVKDWEKELLAERASNGGWIMNAFGHPMSIIEHKTRDIVNSFCQNSGHVVLMVLNKHIVQQMKEVGVRSEVPICQDFHDERIGMIDVQEQDKMEEACIRAMDRLNDELQPKIKFSGLPEFGKTIWEFKR